MSSITAINTATATPLPSLAVSKGAKFNEEKAAKLAKDFEAVFVGSALKSMWAGVGEDDPEIFGGQAGMQWRDMLVEQYAKSIETRGGFGLAKPVADGILRLQETSHP